MLDRLQVISEELANKNKVIRFKHNSVFSAIEVASNEDEFMGEIAVKLSNQLAIDINRFKNVILPFCKQYSDLIVTKLADTKQPNRLAKYQVIERRLPTVVQELQSRNYLPVKRTPVQIPDLLIVLKKPEDGIKSVIKFDNTVINELMKEVLVNKTNGDLERIWDLYLSNITGSNINISKFAYTGLENMEDLLILTAIVFHYKDNKPSDIRMSDGNYKNMLNSLYNELTNYIAMAIDKFDITTKIDKLVLGTIDDKTLVVNSVVYDKYLETYAVESLLGLLLSGDYEKVTSLNDCIVAADKYLNKWENANKLEVLKEAGLELNRYKLAYELVLKDLLSNTPDNIGDLIRTDDMIAKDVSNYLETLKDSEILDTINTTRVIVAKIIFEVEDNMFLTFIDNMSEQSKLNPKLTPTEAATLAGVDIVFDYLFDQIEISGR